MAKVQETTYFDAWFVPEKVYIFKLYWQQTILIQKASCTFHLKNKQFYETYDQYFEDCTFDYTLLF